MGYSDVHGRTGTAGVLDASDHRALDAVERFSSSSAQDINAHNIFLVRQIPTSHVSIHWQHSNVSTLRDKFQASFTCGDGKSYGFTSESSEKSERARNDARRRSSHSVETIPPKDGAAAHALIRTAPSIFTTTAAPATRRRRILAQTRAQTNAQRFEKKFALAYADSLFAGIMMDSGSSSNVFSPTQLRAYRNTTGYLAPLTPSSNGWLRSMQ